MRIKISQRELCTGLHAGHDENATVWIGVREEVRGLLRQTQVNKREETL